MVTHSFRIVPKNAPQEPIIVNFDPCKEKLIMLLCNKIIVRMRIKQDNQDSLTMISYLDILKFLGSFSVAQNVHNHLHNRLILCLSWLPFILAQNSPLQWRQSAAP